LLGRYIIPLQLSPRRCMKWKYMMLCITIFGPRQPGNNIDVYLSRLVQDLKLLCVVRVEICDVFGSKTFIMHAMLFFTSMTSQLTIICQGIMPRVVKHVLYVNKILQLINWNTEG